MITAPGTTSETRNGITFTTVANYQPIYAPHLAAMLRKALAERDEPFVLPDLRGTITGRTILSQSSLIEVDRLDLGERCV